MIQHGDGLRFADGSEERPAHDPWSAVLEGRCSSVLAEDRWLKHAMIPMANCGCRLRWYAALLSMRLEVHRMETFQDAVAHMKKEHPCDIQLLWLERLGKVQALMNSVGSRWYMCCRELRFNLGQAPTKYFRQGFPDSQRRESKLLQVTRPYIYIYIYIYIYS